MAFDYNEHLIHKNKHLPLSFCHVTPRSSCYRMPLHWHRSVEIVRILSGNLSIQIKDQMIPATRGDIILINRENIHSYLPDDCVYQVINFDTGELLQQTSLCRNILQIFADSNISILPLNHSDHEDLYQCTVRLFELASKESEDNGLQILGALFELLGSIYMYCHYTENLKPLEAEKRFKILIEYIENNYADKISVDQMAKISYMSVSYFTATFKDYFGKTPIEYLNAYRIEKACVLLANKDLSITEIAHQCGFTSSAYFVKVFKKHKNMIPKEYRSTLSASPDK